MKNLVTVVLLSVSLFSFAQKDSLQLGDKYWEDQIYFNVTYNVMGNMPGGIPNSSFSYGLSLGYIKDIPFKPKGNFSVGIGIGYNFDSYGHDLRVINTNEITFDGVLSDNKMKLNTIEFPIQFRWRTSDAVTYSFWRIYTGIKLGYNISNKFAYTFQDEKFQFRNINAFNKFQTGLELSAGYGAFNFYLYYGLTPVFDNVVINGANLDTKIYKFGLVFYLL